MGAEQSKGNGSVPIGGGLSGSIDRQSSQSQSQSHSGSPANGSVRSGKPLSVEDIPYTSYSTGKPIAPEKGRKPFDQGIVTVTANPFAQYEDLEPELQALQKIPYFTPLIKTNPSFSIGDFFSSSRENNPLDVLKPDGIMALCQLYQQHMKKAALSIAHDQRLLATNIRHLENFCMKISQTMGGKYMQAQEYSENLKAIPQILQLLEKTNSLASKAVKSVELLNLMLPIDERLEPISVHIPYAGTFQPDYPNPELGTEFPVRKATLPQDESEAPRNVQPEITPPPPSFSSASPSPSPSQPQLPPSQAQSEIQPQVQVEEKKERPISEISINSSSEGEMRSRSKSQSGTSELSSESSEKKFRAELIDESREEAEDDLLVVRVTKTTKKKGKKKKIAEIS